MSDRVIPTEVLFDNKLSNGAKLLYMEILYLANNDEGVCIASNQYFQKKFGVSEKTISRWLKELRDNKCIGSVVYRKEGVATYDRREITCMKCVKEHNGKTYELCPDPTKRKI